MSSGNLGTPAPLSPLAIRAGIRYLISVPETKEESALDKLWREYARNFRDFDDLMRARMMWFYKKTFFKLRLSLRLTKKFRKRSTPKVYKHLSRK